MIDSIWFITIIFSPFLAWTPYFLSFFFNPTTIILPQIGIFLGIHNPIQSKSNHGHTAGRDHSISRSLSEAQKLDPETLRRPESRPGSSRSGYRRHHSQRRWSWLRERGACLGQNLRRRSRVSDQDVVSIRSFNRLTDMGFWLIDCNVRKIWFFFYCKVIIFWFV